MKKKNVVIIALTVVVIVFCSFLVSTGYNKVNYVTLDDYSVSEDGTKLTFTTSNLSSMGYIRGFENDGGGVKPHYLTFYHTFGGLNSSFGAKNEFVLELDKNDTEIYFNNADGGYVLVLQKDENTGEWIKP